MERLPQPLVELVEELAKLPGLGPKSALRVALTLLKWPAERTLSLSGAIRSMRERMCLCGRCAGLAETDPCPICADPTRSGRELCVVAEWDSLITLEAAGFYRGQYLVLGGLLAPLDGVTPGQLEIDRLKRRLAEGEVEEVILALGTTLDAEATASYVLAVIADARPGLVVSRLAQGIPLGSEVKHMDRETLRQSLVYRQRL